MILGAKFSRAVQFVLSRALVSLLIASLTSAQFATAQDTSEYHVQKNVEVVLVNLIVRDKSGNLVRGLKRDDFTVLEDGKPQSMASFDFEEVDALAAPQAAQPLANILAPAKTGSTAPQPAAPGDQDAVRGRRLIVLFYDLSSMQPEEIERSVKAGTDYVDKQMSPADTVAVVSLTTSMQINQDFTSDRDILKKAIDSLSPSSGQGFESGDAGTTEGTSDNSNSFTADDTEYNIFNTDFRLQAIQSLAESLAQIQQKKSIIYFSSGMSKTGVENQAELRTAINRAVRANVALYTADMRGLQAVVPGGSADSASLRGTAAYSGQSMRNAFDSNFDTQETISTLANDTGGRAFLDSNDFGAVFKRVQQDTSAYYVISYRSTNPARDGRYRHIAVKTRLPGVKLEYRSGYYAPRDFKHSTHDDREQQLVDAVSSDLPPTDLDTFLGAAYFRSSENRFYVPVALVVRGSQIPFSSSRDKDKATLDIIGVVRDQSQRPVGNVRDTVKLSVDGSQGVRRKNVQYGTAFELPSGKYHLKFVVRENQTGLMGSFETDIVVPDFKKSPLKLSAVVLGTQVQAATKKNADNPLVQGGNELIPNVTHVVSSDQHLYFYYEVYDPAARSTSGQQTSERKNKGPGEIRLLTNIQFFRGRVKTFETPLVEAHQITVPNRKATVFQFEVPLTNLPTGVYTCQVNVIDDAAGTFLFPRLTLLVRDANRQVAETAAAK